VLSSRHPPRNPVEHRRAAARALFFYLFFLRNQTAAKINKDAKAGATIDPRASVQQQHHQQQERHEQHQQQQYHQHVSHGPAFVTMFLAPGFGAAEAFACGPVATFSSQRGSGGPTIQPFASRDRLAGLENRKFCGVFVGI
jgi:hypothetical protein